MNRKDYAKHIAKTLHDHGIQCGVITGNGTTTPNNPEDFPAYFIIEKHSTQDNPLYLHFDFKMGNDIVLALKQEGIPYHWSARLAECFVFKRTWGR